MQIAKYMVILVRRDSYFGQTEDIWARYYEKDQSIQRW
jgi:hypothetical protein